MSFATCDALGSKPAVDLNRTRYDDHLNTRSDATGQWRAMVSGLKWREVVSDSEGGAGSSERDVIG